MIALNQPEVICTHESDLDGLVSGLLLHQLARQLYGTSIPLQSFHYQAWKQRQMTERVAWVSDFTFETRFDRGGWLVVDHHATEVIPVRATLFHDPKKSAAKLCYELCQANGLESDKLARLVELTDIGDLFLEDHPDFATACDYASLVRNYGFRNLMTLIQGDLERLVDHPLLEVMTTRRRVEDPIGYELARADVQKLSATVGLVRVPIGNTNLIVHELLNREATPYSVLATFFKRGMGQYVVSFRSRNGEALEVARTFEGGGGHPNASGTSLPRGVQNSEGAIAYLRQHLAPELHENHLNLLEESFTQLEWAP
jgi:nanoRNase/pAp phosphatase (c-di-AMP/oligoRNAs hydrolase)